MSYQVTCPLVLAKDKEGKVHERYEGAVIDWLPPDQAEHFLGSGLVVELGSEPDDVDEDGGGEPADDEPADEGGDGMPLRAAPKADWVSYVVAKTAGTDSPVTADEADALTKQELIEQYG